MSSVPLKARLRYWFDDLMSKGTGVLLVALFVATIGMLAVIAFFAKLTPDGRPVPFLKLVWMGLMRTLDSGTMGGDEGGWPFLLLMLVVTLGGVFVVGTLIGIITNGIDAKIEELRKGRSRVIESNHTVILGWSNQVFSIITELVIANENQRKSCIAILADQDKVEMEDEIHTKVSDLKNTRIVCRTGSPMDLDDLEIVNPHEARSIIVISPEADNPDAAVIKTILAITNHPNRRKDRSGHWIVGSIRDPRNMEAALLVARDEAQVVPSDELISRITAQTCRQSGLSVVYTELLDFGGDEIYFSAEPRLNGKTFGEALLSYSKATVMGLRMKDGSVRLNPPMDTVIQDGDQVIAIAEDDDKVIYTPLANYEIDQAAIAQNANLQPSPERTLILGWNERAPMIVHEMDYYVAPGSEIKVVASVENAQLQIECSCGDLQNTAITFEQGDTTSRRVLEALNVEQYHHIIVLSYSHLMDEQEADASTLITLLHLREIGERKGRAFSIVSEMLDVRNRELAEVSRADDFIVSDRLISLLLSQVSENPQLMAVFTDLFDPEGSEIYLKPAEKYVRPGTRVNFYTLLEAGRQRGEVVIGYRKQEYANDASQSYGVRINPDKSEKFSLALQDRVIVLAES